YRSTLRQSCMNGCARRLTQCDPRARQQEDRGHEHTSHTPPSGPHRPSLPPHREAEAPHARAERWRERHPRIAAPKERGVSPDQGVDGETDPRPCATVSCGKEYIRRCRNTAAEPAVVDRYCNDHKQAESGSRDEPGFRAVGDRVARTVDPDDRRVGDVAGLPVLRQQRQVVGRKRLDATLPFPSLIVGDSHFLTFLDTLPDRVGVALAGGLRSRNLFLCHDGWSAVSVRLRRERRDQYQRRNYGRHGIPPLLFAAATAGIFLGDERMGGARRMDAVPQEAVVRPRFLCERETWITTAHKGQQSAGRVPSYESGKGTRSYHRGCRGVPPACPPAAA